MLVRSWIKTAQVESLQNVVKSFPNVELREETEYEPGADIDIIFGSWKNRDVEHHNLKRDIVKRSKNVLVVETPLLDRGPQKEVMDDQWFRVGLNGFMRNAVYSPVNEERMSYGLSEKSISSDGTKATDYILVVLQLPGDASLDFIDINEWCVDKCSEIRKLTDRDIVVRFPQLDREFKIDDVKKHHAMYFQRGTFNDKRITLDNAYAVVTYSSGMGVEAILNGNRTFIQSDNGFWSRKTTLDDVLNKQYLNFIDSEHAKNWRKMIESTQWHIDEIKSGKCSEAFECLPT